MRYDWTILDAGSIALDGGGMFGVVPRVLWQEAFPPDERNRITLAHNCLLLRPEDGGKPIVIETGSGDKFDAKSRSIFGLGDRTITTALQEQNIDPADVSHVLVTHLHFDHAGGLTRRRQTGESAAWTDADGTEVVPTFPNARILVQQREWLDARDNHSVMTRTYLPANLAPVAGQIELINSPLPLTGHETRGTVPRRGDRPLGSFRSRSTPVLPDIAVLRVPGHTWGQQAICFTDTQDRDIVFVPDVLPTTTHVGPAYSLAYDVEPYTSMITRGWLLADAVENNWLLVLDHEPKTPVVRVEVSEDWYRLVAIGSSDS